ENLGQLHEVSERAADVRRASRLGDCRCDHVLGPGIVVWSAHDSPSQLSAAAAEGACSTMSDRVFAWPAMPHPPSGASVSRIHVRSCMAGSPAPRGGDSVHPVS